jgi:hypothetical protein
LPEISREGFATQFRNHFVREFDKDYGGATLCQHDFGSKGREAFFPTQNTGFTFKAR